jgi:alpha-L-fucosidase 2
MPQLDQLPDLDFDAKTGAILPVAPGYALSDHNSENTALYPLHPFRAYGAGKPGLAVALATY